MRFTKTAQIVASKRERAFMITNAMDRKNGGGTINCAPVLAADWHHERLTQTDFQ
jgi:hypothetical protein